MKQKQVKIILFFIRNYKGYVTLVSVFSILFAVFEGLSVAVLFPVISLALQLDLNSTKGSGVIQMLNRFIGIIPVKDTFIAACLLIIAVVVLKNIFRYVYTVCSSFTSYRIWDDIQKRLFSKYISADYRYFLDHKQGEIVYRLCTAPASIGGALAIIPQFFTEAMKIVFISAILISMSFSVSCVVIGLVAFFYFFTRVVTKRMSYSIGKGRVEAGEEQSILINEMINGIKQIKVFLAEGKWASKFYRATNSYFKLAKKDSMLVNMPFSALEIFALVSLSVFLIIIRKFSPGTLVLNLPLLGVFAYAFQRIMPSISLMASMRMQVLGQMAVFETLYSVVTEKMASVEDGAQILGSFNEKIEFKNVSFSYSNTMTALKDISISFEKNKCTAIAGSSGSGKTTMVNLLIRLFDPTQGAIFVDGANLREYKRDSWLSKIGFVSQDTFIFHASVRDNIAFGFEQADMNDIIEAAKIANAHDFISKLPKGYDTIVGEKGMKLSGGEQQRLAIARAILRKPQILIFDEATSALDNVSQSLIQHAIGGLIKDHTVILIAHRLSTIVNADKIIVLDRGNIKEMGAHRDLISKKGFYWQLYNNEGALAQEAR